MPKNFTTIKKYLTYEEKLLDFIEDYAIDIPNFEYVLKMIYLPKLLF